MRISDGARLCGRGANFPDCEPFQRLPGKSAQTQIDMRVV